MLYSLYTSKGIVFAEDSRITRPGQTKPEPSQQKLHEVPRIGSSSGLLGYYGLAQVRGKPMSDWLAQTLNDWTGCQGDKPEEFALYLTERMEQSNRTAAEKRELSGFHFGAFWIHDGQADPIFFQITNAHAFNPSTGTYSDIREFHLDEQFMGRDAINWNPDKVRSRLMEFEQANGMPWWYRNGDLLMFGTITNALQIAFREVSRLPGYGPPKCLEGWERLARTMVITTTQVARAFYQKPFPTIGDEAIVKSLPWPVV
jgi:hypothetical protein